MLNVSPESQLQAEFLNYGLLSPSEMFKCYKQQILQQQKLPCIHGYLAKCSFLLALFHLMLAEQFNYRGVNNITDKHYRHI